MVGRTLRIPLGVQIAAVVALFVAAFGSLWTTAESVVSREGRRQRTRDLLDRAGAALAERGAPILQGAPSGYFTFVGPEEWDALDRRLATAAGSALGRFRGVEGGYFLRDFGFIGSASPPGPAPPKEKARGRAGRRGPPRGEFDLIEINADAAIRLRQVVFVVEDAAPGPVAIRTAPIADGGRVLGASWTMTRLDDPLFLDRAASRYRLAASLALAGIALTLLLTLGLARTVRRQAIERDRLQVELRRSERLAALGKLLAGVAHEVRNPLAGIRSTVQLWQRGIGPDGEAFADLLDEVDRLEGIVARLLQFSRADAQDLAPGDLNAVLREVARLARGPAEAQGVAVELELDPALPPVPMAAPALVQVFRNLTTNALQVLPTGGRIRLTTRRSADGRSVEAAVSDTGPGLGPEALEHLFEPFFTTKVGGTGLGLAIAREIALAHRGDLRASNRPEGGAEFVLTLPTVDGAS